MSTLARSVLSLLSFLLTFTVADEAHARKRLRGLAPGIVDSLLLDEQKQVAQTCYWLRSGDTEWKPENGLVLTKTGLTQLARDAYDPLLALLVAARKEAEDYAKGSSSAAKALAKDVIAQCYPTDPGQKRALIDAIRTLVTDRDAPTVNKVQSQLEACAKSLSAFERALPPTDGNGIGKLVYALDQSAGKVGAIVDLFRDPRALANQFDFSPRIVDLMVRTTQAAHDRLDGSAINNLPFGSAAAKWLIEMLMGELLGIMTDHLLWRLEDTEVASRADVSRRACDLLEQAAPRPVITNRMLIRMVLRFVETTEDPQPADETRRERRKRRATPTLHPSSVCEKYPRFCRRMARRLGVKHPGPGEDRRLSLDEIQQAVVPSFEYIDAPSKPDLEVDVDLGRILERAEANGDRLVKATGACFDKARCKMEDINRAMSMIAVAEQMPANAEPVPEVFVEDEDCCCKEPIPEPEALPLQPSPTGTVAILLDRSSSMKSIKKGTGKTKWQHVETALDTVLTNMETTGVSPPMLSLGVFPEPNVADGCTPGPLAQFTTVTAAREWRQSVQGPLGEAELTPLSKAIRDATTALSGQPHAAIIIVTDGVQNGCNEKRADVIAAITVAHQQGILVYVIGIAGKKWYRNLWLEMAGAGGTRGFVPNNLTPDAGRIAKAIDDALAAQRCTVEVPRKPSSIEIDGKPVAPETWEYIESVGSRQIRWRTPDTCKRFLSERASPKATYE